MKLKMSKYGEKLKNKETLVVCAVGRAKLGRKFGGK